MARGLLTLSRSDFGFLMRNSFGAVFVVVMFVSGCGGSANSHQFTVSGTVLLDGKPVPAGRIYIEPDSTQKTFGPGVTAKIVNGKFRTPEEKRVAGGQYRVRIVAFDGVTTIEATEGSALMSSAFETEISLSESSSIQNFNIPASYFLQPPDGK